MAYTGQFQVFEDIIKEIMVVYKHDSRPWLIGYSGGKDSTLLTCLVYEAMKRLKDAGSPLEKTVQWYRRICPQPLMTIPVTYSIQGFMITRRNPSWKILSIKPYSRQENLMPATLITVHSTLPDS